ncbi:MAG: hypothetical protein JNL52_08575 [Flavobacteriales bacterium]|nr:hypothetical protein [Flavobacteriales bacterium]
MHRRALFVLLAAFGLSVLLRAPLLNRPLSAHHEFCTAITLITLHNWWTDGVAAHAGAPTGVFVNEAKHLLPPAQYDANAQALALYYFSHPPLAFDLPYALFVLTGTPPNALGLELFNVFFHLVTALCLYGALHQFAGKGSLAPLFAGLLYLFMPAPLWFHSNAYMGDIFVQNTWALHVLAAMVYFHRRDPADRQRLALFGLTLFLAVYTSWLGVFAGAASGALALWLAKRDRDPRWLRTLAVVALATAAALGLTLWRYTRLVDLDALLGYFVSRFEVRGTTGTDVDLVGSLRDLVLLNYRIGYLPVILLVLGLVVWYKLKRRDTTWRADQGLLLFVVLTGLPVLLDHAVLLPYAEHDFAALKGGLLLCGLGGLLLDQLPARSAYALLVATCVAGVLYFYRTNPLPGYDGGRYAKERDLGEAIGREARVNEVLFFEGPAPEPQVLWYAKRHIIQVNSSEEALRFLRQRGLHKGVIFRPTPEGLLHEHVEDL